MDFRQKSWWLEDFAHQINSNLPLLTNEKTDITIIGGGFTGLSTAYHLKQLNPELDVRVLESEVCGFGASGRNGGFSMTLFGLTKGITKFRFNDQKAKSAHTYMERAVDYLDGFISENRLQCDYEKSGYLLVATNKAQIKRLEHEFKIIHHWGIKDIERWPEEKLRQEFNTDYYKLGWFEPRCGILNPAKLSRGMKELAEKAGAVIYENSPVTGSAREKTGEFRVSTEKGEIRSEYLVFATNAYSILFPRLRSLQTPAFTHIVLTEPLTREQMESIGWQCRAGVEDARDLIHYYRLTSDNRIVMGGGDVSLSFGKNLDKDLNQKIFNHLENHITQIFPQLKGVRITHRWGGPVSVTVDMAPVIGYLGNDRKALFSLGYIGHGVSTTTLNGKTIAELICNKESENTDMFFVGRKTIPWPREPFRYGIIHAIRGFMKFEDTFIYK